MANAPGPADPRRTGTRVDAVLDLIDRALAEYDATAIPAPVRRRTGATNRTRRASVERRR
ncbi:MAG TPA: hypothetical protein VFZ83_10705 [Acidimicrobiia bacterium]|nr:hypothetical protein [Acidimicrobiia bacterium]